MLNVFFKNRFLSFNESEEINTVENIAVSKNIDICNNVCFLDK